MRASARLLPLLGYCLHNCKWYSSAGCAVVLCYCFYYWSNQSWHKKHHLHVRQVDICERFLLP
jgi:hypothetical protein